MGQIFGKYKIHLLLAVGIAAGLAFWLSASGGEPSNSLLTAEDTSSSVPGEKGVVDTLLQLRAVSLSGTIFSDQAFAYLQDFGTQIIPEPIGRPNPFAPFSLRSTATATTTATTTAATTTRPAAPRR